MLTPAYGSDPASVNPPYWRRMPVSDTDDALSRLIDCSDLIEAAGRTFLLIEAAPVLMDFLEGYGADRADMEDGGDTEDEKDDEDNWQPAENSNMVVVGRDGTGRGSDGSVWKPVPIPHGAEKPAS